MAGITYEIDDKNIVEQIKSDAMKVAAELVEVAKLKKGDIVVVGTRSGATPSRKSARPFLTVSRAFSGPKASTLPPSAAST